MAVSAGKPRRVFHHYIILLLMVDSMGGVKVYTLRIAAKAWEWGTPPMEQGEDIVILK